MGASAQASTAFTLIVTRGTTTLSSGDPYVSGETLTWSLPASNYEWLLDSTSGGASITSGYCSNKRYNSKSPESGTFVMPSSGSGDVLMSVGFAPMYGTVSISQFTLAAATSSPSVAPTAVPSPIPGTPTLGPTTAPTDAAAILSDVESYPNEASTDMAVGLVVSIIGVVLLIVLLHVYLRMWKNRSLPDLSKYPIAGTLACFFGFLSLLLVCMWTDTKHYTFMAGGFFFGQVQGV